MAPIHTLQTLEPKELDWRKPLYHTATTMVSGKASLRRLAPLGDYEHTVQRIDLLEKEIAQERQPDTVETQKEPANETDGELLDAHAGVDTLGEHPSAPLDAKTEGPTSDLDLLSAYRTNPFHVLGATPRHNREELVMLQRDEALFGNERTANEALSKLTHPESRLEAEIHWFPKATPEDVDALLHHVEIQQDMPCRMAFMPAMPSTLAQFNAIRLLLSKEPVENAWDLEAHILSLATIADGLLTEQVMDDINDDREQALFTPLDYQPLVDMRIEDLLNEAIAHIIARRPSILTNNVIRTLDKYFETCYTKRDSVYHNSYFLELASESLHLL